MKKMKLNTESGREAIDAKLGEVQHRTSARNISLKQIETILHRVEVNLGIPKYKLDGVTVHFTGAEHFPNAYKYAPESTHFYAVHDGKTWVIEKIERDRCPNNRQSILITLTDQAKAAVLENICIMDY